ncbi:hypothetical protein D3C87_1466320 [compost metagenome]
MNAIHARWVCATSCSAWPWLNPASMGASAKAGSVPNTKGNSMQWQAPKRAEGATSKRASQAWRPWLSASCAHRREGAPKTSSPILLLAASTAWPGNAAISSRVYATSTSARDAAWRSAGAMSSGNTCPSRTGPNWLRLLPSARSASATAGACCAASNADTGSARAASRVSTPAACRKARPSASAWDAVRNPRPSAALCRMAREKRGRRANIAQMDDAPADWPMSVMRSGSPPRSWMLSSTQSMAASWSSRPTLAVCPGT